jgi:signal transduction histidine kinase
VRDPTRADLLRLSITVGAVAALALGAIAAGLAVESGPERTRMATAPGGVQLLRDPTGALTFEQVLALRQRGTFAGAFARMDPNHTNFSYTGDVFWLVMELPAAAGRPGGAVIELTTTPERAVLYAVDGLGRVAPPQLSGTERPFRRRPLIAANVAFPVTLPTAGQALTVYLQVRSRDTMILDPLLWDRAAFDGKERNGRLLDGAYYGAMLSIVLYNLFLFLGTADRTYLAYVVFELLLVVYQAIADKYALEYLWPKIPAWADRVGSATPLAAAMAGLVFADGFLGLRRAMPRAHRGFQALLFAAALLLGFILAGARVPRVAVPAYVVAAIVAATCAGARLAQAGDRQALLFLVAWSLLFAGTILAVLSMLGFLQAPHWFVAIKIGSGLEGTLMSLVLAHRIAALRRERERARTDLLALRTAQAEALERRVSERTRELAETVEHLRQTRAAFARQDRLATVGRMVAGVVHEVGNPLNFLRGGVAEIDRNLAALNATLASPDPAAAFPAEETGPWLGRSQRALALVRGGCEQIDQIVQNLRGYVRRDPPPPELTDVVGVLRSTLSFLDGTLRDGGVELVTDWRPVPPVLFIPGQLGQVMTNLIVNACQAMPQGGRLFVGCGSEAEIVQIIVRDSGPGVPRELRERIFEPFVSGRAGDANAGLGLYVCHEIVTHNGGSLRLAERSEGPDEGATFCLSLPRPAA